MPLTKKNSAQKNKTIIFSVDELHENSISMLKEVMEVLDKFNLTYWIEGGALLGAIRNKKLIPWDDEIDMGTYASTFPKLNDFCDELEKRGLISKFVFDRIRIVKKDWKIGYYAIDLHLWRLVDGNYICDYIGENESHYSFIIRSIERLERLFSYFNYKNKVEYYRLKNIVLLLMSNNIDPKDWKNIRFIKGPLNMQESFILKGSKFCIVNDPIKNSVPSDLIYSMIRGIFKILPNFLINKFNIALSRLYKLKKYDYGILKIPHSYYDNPATISFHGIKINIPKKSKDYLKMVYGENWRIPNLDWKRKEMKVISR